MRTTKIWRLCTLSFFSLFLGAQALAEDVGADDVLGFWLTEEKTAVIEMKKDESDSTYYGEIVWLKEIHTGELEDKLDANNPDEKLRKRSLMGLRNTWGFKFNGYDQWDGGKIYDPKSGKTYSAQMELDDKDELDLRGYVGIPLFGRSTEWKRIDSRVPKNIE